MAIDFLSTVPSRHGHFLMESGYHTDVWMDLETLCLQPAAIEPFATELARRLRRHDADAICGPLNEGAFVALLVAKELRLPFFYAERFAVDGDGLFRVRYRLPEVLRPIASGKRVAIVNDVISAGSAVRGTLADLEAHGATVPVIGALLLAGSSFRPFADERRLPIESLAEMALNIWPPAECPLCQSGLPVTRTTGACAAESEPGRTPSTARSSARVRWLPRALCRCPTRRPSCVS